jgi:hypothetical protein
MKRFCWTSLLCLALAGCSKSNNNAPNSPSEPECGVERWHVKILTDPASANINWNSIGTTLAEQNAFPTISMSEDTIRMDFEKQVVSVQATIVAFKKEDDKDIHLILIDNASDSMIAEIPGTVCGEVAASPHAADFQSAAAWVANNLGTPSTEFKQVNKPVTVTGILFQDFAHGQDGHAKNYREIHPVLNIQ